MTRSRRQSLNAVVFMAPGLLLFAALIVYPVIYTFQASTLKWDGVNAGEWVGLGNFRDLRTDKIFQTSLKNSGLWIVLTFIPQSVIGFLLAWVLNKKIRGRNLYRAIFFVPAILSPIAVALTWQRLLDPFNGVVAQVGRATNIEFLTRSYLGDPKTAIYAAIFVNVWMWTGFSMLFYLAGLQQVETSILEAARIDGANEVQTIWRIVLPLLRGTHVTLLILGVIGSLKTFDLVYALTEGGPNHASELMPTYTFFSAFRRQEVGYGAAISVVLMLVAVIASSLLNWLFDDEARASRIQRRRLKGAS